MAQDTPPGGTRGTRGTNHQDRPAQGEAWNVILSCDVDLDNDASAEGVLDVCGMEANATGAPETFYECRESSAEELPLEVVAQDLLRTKDYSFESCEKLARRVCEHARNSRRRQAHGEQGSSIAFGAYSHGNFHGIIKKTFDHVYVVRYMNAFLRAHGAKGTWSSLQINVNCRPLVHRDQHNHSDTLASTISFGNFRGGRLWIETDPEAQVPEIGVPHIMSDGEGRALSGHLVDTRALVKFDGRRKHGVEEWEGDRISITAYTTRGVSQLARQERDMLRSFGFPVGQDTPTKITVEDKSWKNEHARRPKKSIRRQIMRGASRASALLTLSMTAASSYVAEVMLPSSSPDRPSILEIGDFAATYTLAGNGSSVIEPVSWGDFVNDSDCQRVLETIHALHPCVVWIRGHDEITDAKSNEIASQVFSAALNQILLGGIFVLSGNKEHMLWRDHAFNSLLNMYETQLDVDAQGFQVLRVAQPGVLQQGPHSVYVGEIEQQDPEGEQPQAVPPERLDAARTSNIKFDAQVPKPVQASLGRLHQNLGHPSNHDLARHLRLAGAEEHVIQACKHLRCQVCDRAKQSASARPACLPSLLDFNQLVSVDVFTVFDAAQVKHSLLSVIDHATTFHLVGELEGHSAEAFERKFTQMWGSVFGARGTIAADLETGLQAGLANYAEFHGCRLRPAAGQAHWQQGLIKRHGLWYQAMLRKVIDEKSIDASDLYYALQAVNSAKNELRRRHGFSPTQAVFGKDPKIPGELCAGDDEERYLEILSHDRQRQREMHIRASARIAFYRTQLDSKLRRALIQRARVKRGGYCVGELVCFFRVDKGGTKSNFKRGKWRGPGTIIGHEGGNWWVSFGGRCHLVAEEHLRPSTSEELGEILTTRIARDDLERLLNLDPDDPATYEDEDHADDIDADEGQEQLEGDEMDFQFDLEPEDLKDELTAEDRPTSERRGLEAPVPPPVPKRVRKKGPGVQSVHMLKQCRTARSLEKQYEKEIPWAVIPPEQHSAFRQAEEKQYDEHIKYQALEPLSLEESARVRECVDKSRILSSRFAYKDKNWSRRKLDSSLPWKPKARIVVSGHRDPDIGLLDTDAPTINRLSVLTIMQLVASRRQSHGWEASAGDITAAFLNGDALERVLYLRQPRSGLASLHPDQLLRITKGIFGVPDSPRKWWRRFRKDMLAVRLSVEGVEYKFVQNALDPCLFQLVPSDNEASEPAAYAGVHVDDILVAGDKKMSEAIRNALSSIFPVDDWEINSFDYIGSHIEVNDSGVFISQEAYAGGRLFQIDIGKGQEDEEPASEEQRIDNQSLIGALSWLGSQSRPDIQCSVSLAQQLQKNPSVADLKFTNQIARRAWDHRDKGIWLRPLKLESLEFLVYHDSAWANAELTGEDGFRLEYEDHVSGVMKNTPFDIKERKAKRANSKVASQFGILIFLTDGEQYSAGGGVGSILDWKSSANPRVCRSTFGAETTGCSEAIEMGQYVRSFVQTVLRGRLQRVQDLSGSQLKCITDCKSLFDHLHREGIPRIPSDKRLAIDLAALRQYLCEEQANGKPPLFWVPTEFQLADILTKPKCADSWWATVWGAVRLPFISKDATKHR